MDHEGVADVVAAVGGAAVPQLAAEEQAVAGLAQRAVLAHAVPLQRRLRRHHGAAVCAAAVIASTGVLRRVGSAAGAVAAGYDDGGPHLFGDVVQVDVGGGDEDGEAHPGVCRHVLRQGDRQPVGVQGLIGAARPHHPGVHGDDVAVAAVDRLGQVDQARLVEVLEEHRVAVERVVDALVQVAVALRRHVGVQVLRHRLDALGGGAQLGDLGGVQEPRHIEVPVPFQRLDLLLQRGVGNQRQGSSHGDTRCRAPPVVKRSGHQGSVG